MATKPKIQTGGIKLLTQTIEEVPIDLIKPNSYNPNRQSDHEFSMLKLSITEDGFTQPVVVLPDNTIVDGEHRWRAAKELGMTVIPVVRIDIDEARRRISTIRHNQARGSHDIEDMAAILKDLQSLGQLNLAFDSLLMDQKDVDRLLNDIMPPEELGAGQEWSSSWLPDNTGGTRVEEGAVSTAAQEQAALRRDKDRSERDRQERGLSKEEHAAALRTVSINFVFTQEQWAVVQHVLGANRSDGLYRLCLDQASAQRGQSVLEV